ncbi:hypothetical protein [Rhizobium rhizogenes]|uniref:Uncharacterized protein n=1 Tax=Rhizobium rhizogenes TaxID=359 RepID=A0AA92C733_RHIRH|nr:hypothetical protein [Rhizobium rhizogenes]PVE57189.1 hypothetical protein DC430_05550 [Rhizobium rhizogenes]PVE68296.1 hypothetical protein DC415_00665 [Agrobacterium tumefaciens]PVE78044.1 hypothetical protein DCP16_00665 [Sphingomonas sp. TPD3009]
MTDVLDRPGCGVARWKAVAEYRSQAGIVDVEHAIEELEELHDLIERGPDWNTLVKITVTFARPVCELLTIEEAARL